MKLVKMLVVVALVFVVAGVLGIRLAGSGLQADARSRPRSRSYVFK